MACGIGCETVYALAVCFQIVAICTKQCTLIYRIAHRVFFRVATGRGLMTALQQFIRQHRFIQVQSSAVEHT